MQKIDKEVSYFNENMNLALPEEKFNEILKKTSYWIIAGNPHLTEDQYYAIYNKLVKTDDINDYYNIPSSVLCRNKKIPLSLKNKICKNHSHLTFFFRS